MTSKSPRRGRSSTRAETLTRSISHSNATKSKSRFKSRSRSPIGSSTVQPSKDPQVIEKAFMRLLLQRGKEEEEDYKSIKLPTFSDGSEWEAVVFELKST